MPTGLANDATGWVTLAVTVHNSTGLCDLAVNGEQVAADLKLRHVSPAGQARCVSLVCCRGHVAYDDVKVTPIASSGKASDDSR